MPAMSRRDGVDQIQSPHGAPHPTTGVCTEELIIVTMAGSTGGSDDVFTNNIGQVRKGDLTIPHPNPHYPPPPASPPNTCDPHQPPLVTHSPDVFANNKEVGRIGDYYTGDVSPDEHPLITGSDNVFANGS